MSAVPAVSAMFEDADAAPAPPSTTRTGISIRVRILIACLLLTLLTMGLGLFTLRGQDRLGALALRMYDQAFMSVDFFRTAQLDFVALKAASLEPTAAERTRPLAAKVVEDLDVAIERATSLEAREAATGLRSLVMALLAGRPTTDETGRLLARAESLFERGSEQFAQDGFAFRLQAEQVAKDSQFASQTAIAASLVAALLITVNLTHSIVPPLRRATVIATEIARGNLKNEITPKGTDETVMLLGALRVMQSALAERQAAAKQIEHMAHHDVLTGLCNRFSFTKAMERARIDAAEGAPFSLLLLDLDRFKPVNDTYGHAVGDALLQAVARRLRRCVRDQDVVARLGGDEFAILQSGSSVGQSEQLARRAISTLTRPFDLNGTQVTIGTSVGICLSDGSAENDELFRHADAALYSAKASGRGSFRVADASPDLVTDPA